MILTTRDGRLRVPVTALAIWLVTLPVTLQAQDSNKQAIELGSVLSSEQACGLAYNQAAIQAWVDENIEPTDMGFAGTLDVMRQSTERDIEEISASMLTANCRAVERVARQYGFIE